MIDDLRPGFSFLFVALVGCLAIGGAEPSASDSLTRAEFVSRFAQVKRGMPREEVLKLLGNPDDIVTPEDEPAKGFAVDEFWCYGAKGHLAFPTLGTIGMVRGQAFYLRHSALPAPDPNLLSEADIQTYLPLLDTTPPVWGGSFDPLTFIRIVNKLQPLGREKGVAVISEYLRAAPPFSRDSIEGTLLLLRALFEVPETLGYQPELLLGGTFPLPLNPRSSPRFPLIILDDVPLLQVRQYVLGGMGEPPEEHLRRFPKSVVWRSQPLKPTGNPLGVLAKLERSPQWAYNHPFVTGMSRADKVRVTADQKRDGRYLAMGQLARLIRTVNTVPAINGRPVFVVGCDDAKKDRIWKPMEARVRNLGIRWSSVKECYVLPDGTTLSEKSK